eukprot:gene10494-11422_t
MAVSDILFYVSFGLILLYFAITNWLTKALPIWVLALSIFFKSLKKGNNKHSLMIIIGLIFSSFGDIFLEIVDHYKAEHLFIPGLVSFLLAHLAYIYGMYVPISTTTYFSLPVLFAYYYWIMSQLIPKAKDELRIPILIYGIAICSMGLMAINRVFSSSIAKTSAILGLLGSLSFVLSDSILAFNKFYAPIENAKFLVMVTYYSAQILITASVLSAPSSSTKVKK